VGMIFLKKAEKKIGTWFGNDFHGYIHKKDVRIISWTKN
jgi:hypothetical protein